MDGFSFVILPVILRFGFVFLADTFPTFNCAKETQETITMPVGSVRHQAVDLLRKMPMGQRAFCEQEVR